jgi:gliding motility-associated-like protein
MNKPLILLLLYSTICIHVFAQTGLNIIEGPVHTIPCDSTCVMLHTTYPKQLRSNQYSFTNIPYTPTSIAGTSITLSDDKFSNNIPLNFSFCFFEQVYSTCYVSDNGVITFNPLYANDDCYNNTQQLLPYFNSTCPDNAIFGLFMDLAPSQGGSITYATVGATPNRKFCVKYQGLKLFGASCSGATSTFQIELHETTNIIDIFINNKAVCNSSSANSTNYSTIGIQNIGATLAFTAPGKHASVFTATNEGIRISPSGIVNYNMTWKNASNQIIATNTDSIYFCPPTIPYSQITATVTYSCPAQTFNDTVQLIKNGPAITNIAIVQPLCANSNTGSITVTATGAGSLTYAINNSIFTSTNVFSSLTPGIYIIWVKDANGCKTQNVVTIIPTTQLIVIIDTIIKPTCPNSNGSATVHATGGTPAYTYQWSNGQTGGTISNVPAGTYNVTVTDANGCTTLVAILIQNAGLPDINAIKINPICGNNNGSITPTVTGGNPPYTYLWTGLGTNPNLTNLSPGLYTLLVTDILGCQSSKPFYLVDTLTIQLYKTVQHTTCGLNNGAITQVVWNSIAPYTYSWTPSGQTVMSPSNLAAGTHTVTITANNGCTRIDSTIVLPSLATVNQISYANANCDSSNGIISLNGVLNYANYYTRLWSNGSSAPTWVGLAPGTYWIKTIDSLGCIDVDTIHLINDGRPHLNILTFIEPTCYGDSTGSVTLSGTSGISPYKYSLDGINFSSLAQIDSVPGGTFTIYITDANSCPNDTLVTFPQPDEIVANIIADTINCFADENASIQISANGGTGSLLYAFNNGTFDNQQLFTGLSSGFYTINVIDSRACTETFVKEVVGPTEPLRIVLTINDVACFANSNGSFAIELKGGWSPYSYTWSNPNFTGLSMQNLDVTQGTISVKDDRNCETNGVVDIKQLYCCKAVIPSAFSPNGDNKNNRLKILPISVVSELSLKIFNRFGQNVFSTKDINASWDGTFKNEKCDVGTYYYLFTYKCPFQEETVVQHGDVTLIR